MRILFLIFILFFIPLLFPDIHSELLIEVDKDAILPFGDTATITMNIDYIPKNNVVIVQFFDSRDLQFSGGREISVDENGFFSIDFQGYKQAVIGGIYKVVVTGMNEKNEIIKNTGYFPMGVKQENILNEQNSDNGGCLIATATYDTELAPQVQTLREIRDNVVLTTKSGTLFMAEFNSFYYSFAPIIADWERQNSIFKEITKIIITPMLASLSILNHVDINSEYDLVVYGIGIILLNIGIYFMVPGISILKTYHYLILNFQKSKHLT
jgi:hypothetical protein